MPHRSLNTARMEAVAEGAAQAEREPGEGRSEDHMRDRGREAPRTSFRDRRFAPAIDPESRNAREGKSERSVKDFIMDEQLFCFIMDKVLTDAIPRTLLL
jgi:hypothetical protein